VKLKKLIFFSVLVAFLGICFTASAFADFYVIPVKTNKVKITSTIVPLTGQEYCWDTAGTFISCSGTGQDGEYQMGNNGVVDPSSSNYRVPSWEGERFTDNNDGTVIDNLTILIWLKDANSLSGSTNWASALNYCNNLEAGGHTDWRLPNSNELRSLYEVGESNPALPDGHPFTGVQSSCYWSSTTLTAITSFAFFVDMNNGGLNPASKETSYYVWPVRGGN
jgi:hypothetical protein